VRAAAVAGALVLLGAACGGVGADRDGAAWAPAPDAAVAPVELVELAPAKRAHCARSRLLRPLCPRLVPRVRAPYLSHLARDVADDGPMHVFDLSRGATGADPAGNRPPRSAHAGLVAGDTERIAPWREPWQARAERLRDGVVARERREPVSFGIVRLGAREGLLLLAPPYPRGGYLADHLVFVWKERDGRRAISLHAWEPAEEAWATLRGIALSTDALRR